MPPALIDEAGGRYVRGAGAWAAGMRKQLRDCIVAFDADPRCFVTPTGLPHQTEALITARTPRALEVPHDLVERVPEVAKAYVQGQGPTGIGDRYTALTAPLERQGCSLLELDGEECREFLLTGKGTTMGVAKEVRGLRERKTRFVHLLIGLVPWV